MSLVCRFGEATSDQKSDPYFAILFCGEQWGWFTLATKLEWRSGVESVKNGVAIRIVNSTESEWLTFSSNSASSYVVYDRRNRDQIRTGRISGAQSSFLCPEVQTYSRKKWRSSCCHSHNMAFSVLYKNFIVVKDRHTQKKCMGRCCH